MYTIGNYWILVNEEIGLKEIDRSIEFRASPYASTVRIGSFPKDYSLAACVICDVSCVRYSA